MILNFSDFLALRQTLPVVDVRSENEFASGHMPNAVNIPILNNAERVAVGTDYKQKGPQEAIRTGFRLVGPRIADIVTEAEQVANKGELIVHCWRGGMRSSNFCQFVGMANVRTHQLQGGYKRYREAVLASFAKPLRLIVIGGSTGSGKSELLRALKTYSQQVIDLEGLALHKGSAFGGLMMPAQPSTEQFQNNLFETILELDPDKPIWIEDESIAVGKIFLPEALWRTMLESPAVEICVDKPGRIDRLVREYGNADRMEFLAAMQRITKKLGGQHFKSAKEKFDSGDMAATIDILLTYYDKAYARALEKKQERIIAQVAWDGKDSATAVAKLVSLLPAVNKAPMSST